MVYLLGSIGWVIEALVTAAVIGFVARVRPSLVFEAGALSDSAPRSADHGSHR
jgi:hypothetical protein